MGSVAEFDLMHVAEKINGLVDLQRVMVYSRFFTFRWAPQNIFSYFWSKVQRFMVKSHGTQLMFSFVNPNMGFDGCSFRGCNWELFAYEHGTMYSYVDGQYRTVRSLHGIPRYHVSTSQMELLPLRILAVPMCKEAGIVMPDKPYEFTRPNL